MKTWIYICASVLAAGVVTVLAEETRTNAASGTPAGEAAGPPPAVVPATPTSPPPAQPKITTAPRMSPESSGAGHKGASTNPPPGSTSTPAVTEEVKPPEEGPLMPTNAVPAEAGASAATPTNAITSPPESSGLGNKEALTIGATILAVAGVVAIFMLRRYCISPRGSLITSAMNVSKNENKDEDKDEAGHEAKGEEKREEKKAEKKFPPPLR